jgi:hypothetical protein
VQHFVSRWKNRSGSAAAPVDDHIAQFSQVASDSWGSGPASSPSIQPAYSGGRVLGGCQRRRLGAAATVRGYFAAGSPTASRILASCPA